MSGCKTIVLVLLVPGVLGVLLYRWLDSPVPDGYSPESAAKIRQLLMISKALGGLAKIGELMGVGSSLGHNHRRLVDFLVEYDDAQGIDKDIREVDHVFDGVPVRVYEPVHRTGVLPGFVWYHGGGWVVGSLNGAADTVRRLCKQTNSVVVSVDYRLAPEHVFPAAFQDCLTATKYFLTNADQFNVDPTRVAIGGDSAGGNLAAAVALRLRDETFQPIVKLQILVYPVTQALDFLLPSYIENADGPVITQEVMAYFTAMYLDGNEDKISVLLENGHVSPAVKKTGLPFIDVSKLPSKYLVGYTKPSVDTGSETVWNEMKDKLLNPYFSPLVADRLDNLPPAYVFTAEHDPLRDEGILYAERLRENGVNVTHHHSDIGIHNIMVWSLYFPEADKLFREMTNFIVGNL